jgi:hypothetical protein
MISVVVSFCFIIKQSMEVESPNMLPCKTSRNPFIFFVRVFWKIEWEKMKYWLISLSINVNVYSIPIAVLKYNANSSWAFLPNLVSKCCWNASMFKIFFGFLKNLVYFESPLMSLWGMNNCLIPKRSKTSFQRKWAVLFKQKNFKKYL